MSGELITDASIENIKTALSLGVEVVVRLDFGGGLRLYRLKNHNGGDGRPLWTKISRMDGTEIGVTGGFLRAASGSGIRVEYTRTQYMESGLEGLLGDSFIVTRAKQPQPEGVTQRAE